MYTVFIRGKSGLGFELGEETGFVGESAAFHHLRDRSRRSNQQTAGGFYPLLTDIVGYGNADICFEHGSDIVRGIPFFLGDHIHGELRISNIILNIFGDIQNDTVPLG